MKRLLFQLHLCPIFLFCLSLMSISRSFQSYEHIFFLYHPFAPYVTSSSSIFSDNSSMYLFLIVVSFSSLLLSSPLLFHVGRFCCWFDSWSSYGPNDKGMDPRGRCPGTYTRAARLIKNTCMFFQVNRNKYNSYNQSCNRYGYGVRSNNNHSRMIIIVDTILEIILLYTAVNTSSDDLQKLIFFLLVVTFFIALVVMKKRQQKKYCPASSRIGVTFLNI